MENQGSYEETFNVTLYANTTVIDTTENITLASRDSTTLNFTWNTRGLQRYSNYTLEANATTVSGEIDTDDNKFIGLVAIVIPGDVDGDKDVDQYDAVKLLVVYGAKKDNPKYDPNCDVDGDGDIDLYDAVTLFTHYGQKYP